MVDCGAETWVINKADDLRKEDIRGNIGTGDSSDWRITNERTNAELEKCCNDVYIDIFIKLPTPQMDGTSTADG